MAYIRLKEHRTRGDIVIQGAGETVYSINEKPVEIPARIAALYLGDEQMIVEFIDSDKKDIKSMPENRLVSIREHLGLDEGADVLNVLYPKKARPLLRRKLRRLLRLSLKQLLRLLHRKRKHLLLRKQQQPKKNLLRKQPLRRKWNDGRWSSG